MKMSPPLGGRVFDGGVAVKERDTAIQALIELDLGTREAEAPGLGRDVEAAPLPLHDVVVADDALMDEAADAIQLLGSGPPSGGCNRPRDGANIGEQKPGSRPGPNGVR